MSCRGVRPTTGTAGWKLGHEPRLLVWEWWGNGGLGAPATETLAGDLDENGARDCRDVGAHTLRSIPAQGARSRVHAIGRVRAGWAGRSDPRERSSAARPPRTAPATRKRRRPMLRTDPSERRPRCRAR